MQKNRSLLGAYLCRLTAFLAALSVLITCLSASAQGSEDSQVIAISGTGAVTLVPDTASITLGINLRGNDLTNLQMSVDAAVGTILTKLRALNIDDKDLAATNIRISPRYRYNQSQQQSVADGYEVSRDIRVTVHDLALLSPVMSEASSAGINRVSPPQLSSSKYEENYQKALALAVEQAKQRATALANAAEVKLGPVVRMSTLENNFRPDQPMRMVMESDAAEAAYQPGEMRVIANVKVAFAISP